MILGKGGRSAGAEPAGQGAGAVPRGARVVVAVDPGGPRRFGDLQMGPAARGGEPAEERGSRGGVAAARPGGPQVGEGREEFVVVLVDQREPPQQFPRLVTGRGQV